MSDPNNAAVRVLQNYAKAYAQKAASDGAPDRLTVEDGQGGITAAKQQPKKDPGETDLKQDLPTDGTTRTSDGGSAAGESLTVADGQGGITTQKQQPKKDPGEADLKTGMPTNCEARKSAADRVLSIRSSIAAAQGKPAPVAPTQKSATQGNPAPQLDLSTDVLAKIASAILASDEGINYAYRTLEKQAGAAVAHARINEAIEMANQYDANEQVKQAAFTEAQDKATNVYNFLIDNGVTEADCDGILKTAALHQSAIMEYEHPMLKAAYAQAMDDAGTMEAADEAAGAEGAPPVDEALPMGGEQLSEEEIMQLLQEMIASGEITAEDVQAALAAEGGAADPALAEGGGAPPMEEAPPVM